MTEAEWLACADPDGMLPFLRGQASDRKLRLVACEACRDLLDRLFQLAPDAVPENEVVWNGLHSAERFLAGHLLSHELAAAEAVAADHYNPKRWLEYALVSTARGDAWEAADQTFMALRDFVDEVDWYFASPEQTRELDDLGFWDGQRQVVLLHDVFGNPFRPIAPDPSWLTSTVVALAKGIYDERAFERMPILADALQDAGCANEDVLSHCRDTNQVHVRGCWVVDLVLGKR